MCNSRQWLIAINNRLGTFPDDVMMQKPRQKQGMRLPELGGSKVKVNLRLSVSVLNFHGFLFSFSLLASCATTTVQINFQAMDVNKYMYIQNPIGLLIRDQAGPEF